MTSGKSHGKTLPAGFTTQTCKTFNRLMHLTDAPTRTIKDGDFCFSFDQGGYIQDQRDSAVPRPAPGNPRQIPEKALPSS